MYASQKRHNLQNNVRGYFKTSLIFIELAGGTNPAAFPNQRVLAPLGILFAMEHLILNTGHSRHDPKSPTIQIRQRTSRKTSCSPLGTW
jgi:hypothetical protein